MKRKRTWGRRYNQKQSQWLRDQAQRKASTLELKITSPLLMGPPYEKSRCLHSQEMTLHLRFHTCVPEFGVAGELAWLAWEDTLAADFLVYRLASSWSFDMFFLYRILLFPNQLATWESWRDKSKVSSLHYTLYLTTSNWMHNSYFFSGASMPVPDLRHSDGTLLGELLLGLLTGVWVCQVGIKIFIQNLRCLLAEVSSFPPERARQVHGLTVRNKQKILFLTSL